MDWDKENECYYKRHRLSNGQFCQVAFYRWRAGRRTEYNVAFAIADKKKNLSAYFSEGKDNNITLKYTGHCGLEALVWCLKTMLEFEGEVYRDKNQETQIVVRGEDHRRFRMYEKGLSRYGYKKENTPWGWAMVKKLC